MTEQEWTIVARAFTGLFDIVKEKAPDRIQIDRVFTAGKILAMEIERIRQHDRAFNFLVKIAGAECVSDTSLGIRVDPNKKNWEKRNEELEKKKQAQREELGDLTDTLKASIENAEKDRQGE